MQGGLDVKQAGALGTVKFVCAHGDQIGVKLLNVIKWFLAEPLNGVGVKNYFAFTTEGADFDDWLEGADFVVRGHDGNEHSVRAEGAFEIFNGDAAFTVHGQTGDGEAFVFFQIIEAMQNRMVLDGRGDEVFALGFEQTGDSENGQVIGLGAAAGEDDFAGLGTQKFSGAVPGIVEQGTGFAANVMDGRGIAPDFVQKRQHGRAYAWVERRGGVVIEINGARLQFTIYDLRFTRLKR